MSNSQQIQLREKAASSYLNVVSAIGFLVFISHLFLFTIPSEILIFLLLLIFITITEYYPIPIWKGTSALSFPLIYTMDYVMGIEVTIVSFTVIVVMVNLIRRRPLRLVWFSPAQLIISLYLSHLLANYVLVLSIFEGASVLTIQLIELIVFTFSYYILNNLIVDILLWIRPQEYTWRHWKMKSIPEAVVAIFSFSYGAVMFMLAAQNRGEVDVFSFLFFFSPLIAISLLSTIFIQVQKEKNRLKSLFSVTTELNRIVLSGNWKKLREVLESALETQATALIVFDKGECHVAFKGGKVEEGVQQIDEDAILSMNQVAVYDHDGVEASPAGTLFSKVIRSLVYNPLLVEGELIGVYIVGRSRSNSFTSEDVQSIATISNQLAVLLKTKALIFEKERRILLEERNRIARQIHDGVAQSLAGAVFKLETACRKFSDKPLETKHLIEDSMKKLRSSLKEIRQSIYALRPYPTEQLGLKHAIIKKIETFREESNLNITFEERGSKNDYSSMVEKVIFDIFQESVRNIIKHAQAKQVHVLLSHSKDRVLLKVEDDGVGFSLFDAMIKAKNEPHYGILNMNEQAEKLGAIFQINSTVGQGTEIILNIPNIEEEEIEDDSYYAG